MHVPLTANRNLTMNKKQFVSLATIANMQEIGFRSIKACSGANMVVKSDKEIASDISAAIFKRIKAESGGAL